MATVIGSFTIDVEPDCPPYLSGYRGIEQGMPALLDLLASRRIHATFFTTGDVAQRYPATIERIVRDGHELASHGMTHRAFPDLDATAARWEIEESARVLRSFAPVTSFRAPYLRFPSACRAMLVDAGFDLDSSEARYKRAPRPRSMTPGLRRIPASLTSSALRLPRVARNAYLRALGRNAPLVMFVHPWEFVDLRREQLRLDCRFRTGETALACIDDTFAWLDARGVELTTMRECARRIAA
jgi:peptidoglycan/xylan/chitin deacetylase (PgdA/CDA1 family)